MILDLSRGKPLHFFSLFVGTAVLTCMRYHNTFHMILYKLRSVQNTGTCYPGQGWFVRNLGWGRQTEAKVNLTNPAEAWVAFPVFCTSLIFFYSIYFPFLYSSAGLVGNLQDCQHAQCPLPLSIVIRVRRVIRQSNSQHALLRCSWPMRTLSGIYATGLVKLQIKWMESVSMGSFQYKNQ